MSGSMSFAGASWVMVTMRRHGNRGAGRLGGPGPVKNLDRKEHRDAVTEPVGHASRCRPCYVCEVSSI